MKPWLAVWLPPFNALQLIVSIRLDDESAEALVDYSARSWLALNYRTTRSIKEAEKLSAAGKAFQAAEVDLQSQCRQGFVKGFGFWESASGLQRDDLANWWDSKRQLGFEHSILTGRPVLRDVRLFGEDVRRTALPMVSPSLARAPEPSTAIPPPIELPPISTPKQLHGVAGRQRSTAQQRTIDEAIPKVFPSGVPQNLSAKQVHGKLEVELGASACPSIPTVNRYLRQMRQQGQ